MGFTLKKILSSFLMPLSIGLILLAIGLLYLFSKNYKKAKLYLSISFVWLFIIGYSPFANSVLKPLEDSYPKLQKEVSVKYIVLLGGDYEGRAYEAIRLYYKIKDSKIITLGYSNNNLTPEAIINANKLMKMGIPKEDIIMQLKPKDTQEEAQAIKKIVGNEQFILVTSAYHMPRAMELFHNEGLNPLAAPTNFLLEKNEPMKLPNIDNLKKTEVAFHEYLGLLWNKLKKYKKEYLSSKE